MRGQQVVPSASELLLWGSETHRVMLIEGAVSIYLHKGSSHEIYYLQNPEARGQNKPEVG